MHDVVGVHHLQTFEDSLHYGFDLEAGEFVSLLYLVVELASLEELYADIDGVVGFVYSIQFHQVFVA